jgi:hypothetical protein
LWTSGNTSLSTALDPTPSARSFLATVEQLTSRSSWRASLVAGRSAAQTHYAIGDTILKSVRGRSVHIEPHDVAAVWAHGLEWNPPPVFQRYSAWTPELDARNAAHLWSRAGPQRVLRSTDAPIDSRFDLLDAPLSVRALLCGYAPVAQTERWQALAKVDTTRCSDPDPVARVDAAADAAIAIPAVDPTRQAILVSIEYERDLTDDLATFLYRDDQYWIDFDGARFRLVPASAGVPGLVYVPPSSGWDEPFRVLPRVPHELTLDHRAEVVFYVLDVARA